MNALSPVFVDGVAVAGIDHEPRPTLARILRAQGLPATQAHGCRTQSEATNRGPSMQPETVIDRTLRPTVAIYVLSGPAAATRPSGDRVISQLGQNPHTAASPGVSNRGGARSPSWPVDPVPRSEAPSDAEVAEGER